MMRYLVGLLLLSLSCFSIAQDRIVVFIEDQNVEDNNYQSLDYSNFTDIVFAFANPDGAGDLDFRFSTINVSNFINYAHSQGVRVHLSFGGAANGDAGWVGNTGSYRTQFVDRIATYVSAWDIDGVNLDWEFPAGSQASNYGLFASVLKTKLDDLEVSEGRTIELTCAVAPLQWNTDGISSTFLSNMDYVYAMAFDDGTCNGCGGPNHSSLTLATNAFNYWTGTKGVDANKMVIAIPFYSNTGAFYNSFSNSNPSAYYNDADGSYGGQYYNSMPLIEDKIDMIRTKGGAGIFVWEVTQDRSDQYSLLGGIANYFGDALLCPGPSLGSSLDLCDNLSATLDAGVNKGGMTYQWYINNTPIMTGGDAKTLTVSSAGTYKVVVNNNGCAEKTAQITVTSGLLTYSGEDTICEQDNTVLTVGNHGGETVSWFTVATGGASFTTGTSYTTPVLTSDVTYYVEVEAELGANCQGVAEWSSGAVYAAGGTQVIYNGILYSNMWWTQGDIPSAGGPWDEVASCGGTTCTRVPIVIKVNDCVDGLAEVETSNNISIYPNPSIDHLNIETEYNVENVEIFNATGVLVSDFYLDMKKITLGASMNEGVYFVRVFTDKGAFIYQFTKE